MRQKRSWTSDQKRVVAARAGWRCGHCKELLNSAYEIDHTIPLEDGGVDDIETNASALCSNCHARKTQTERIARVARARERLAQLQAVDEATVRSPKREPMKRPEDVILDIENPFAMYAYMPT